MQHMIFFTHRNGMPSFATSTAGLWMKYHILFETAHLCLNVLLHGTLIFSTPFKKKIRKTLGDPQVLKSPLFEAQQKIQHAASP